MIVALFQVAHAEPSGADVSSTCAAPDLVATLPADGAVDVPVDVQPALLISGCGVQALVTIYETVSGALVLAETWLPGQSTRNGGLVVVPLQVDLTPQTSYDLVVGGWGYEPEILSFTTGDGPLAGEGPAAPTLDLEIGDAIWDGALLLVPVALRLSDLVEGTIVSVNPGEFDGAIALAPEGGVWDLTYSRRVQPGVDLCEAAEVIDLAGRVSPLARVCTAIEVPPNVEDDDPAEPSGCRTVPGGSGLALLALALIRRRRH